MAATSEPVVEKVAVREPVEPLLVSAWSATALVIVGVPGWLTWVVICEGAVQLPAAVELAPSATTSWSGALLVVIDGALTDVPEGVFPFWLASIGVTGLTPR
jgi:hypothetical protein